MHWYNRHHPRDETGYSQETFHGEVGEQEAITLTIFKCHYPALISRNMVMAHEKWHL